MSDFTEMGLTPLNDGESPNFSIIMARFLRDSGMWELPGQPEGLPPPALRSSLEILEETKITEKSKQCPVCLKEIEIGTVLKTMPCKHSFHKECIMPWLTKVKKRQIITILVYTSSGTGLEKNFEGGPIEKFKNKRYFGFQKT